MKSSILIAGAAMATMMAGGASAMTQTAAAKPQSSAPAAYDSHGRTSQTKSGAAIGAGVDTAVATPSAGVETTPFLRGDNTTGLNIDKTNLNPSGPTAPGTFSEAGSTTDPYSLAPVPGTPTIEGQSEPVGH